ncbi:hypothetical protein J6590_100849, partial [Homalodisca vitripennis]
LSVLNYMKCGELLLSTLASSELDLFEEMKVSLFPRAVRYSPELGVTSFGSWKAYFYSCLDVKAIL